MNHDSLEVSVVATQATEEGLADFLFGEGALGLVMEDLREDALTTLIRASFDGSSPIEAIVERLRGYQRELTELGLGGAEGPIRVCRVPYEDWGRTWKEHFRPLPVGRRLIVTPSWENGPFPPGRLPIRIDPAMSFGTGHHASTRMCLEALEDFMDRWSGPLGPHVLDVGTGTGILAIAAAALGAKRVVAVDIDPVACEAAAKNIALNEGGERVAVFQGGIEVLEPHLRFDLVLANLDAKSLCPLFVVFVALIAPAGRAICSGILAGQEAEVVAAARSGGLRVVERRVEGEWLCLTLVPEGSGSLRFISEI